jgi:hypothetical protein
VLQGGAERSELSRYKEPIRAISPLRSARYRRPGKRMDAPCADIFELEGGKIKRFDCYPEGSVILTQLGVNQEPRSGPRALVKGSPGSADASSR